MKLNIESWHTKYYMYFYDISKYFLPNNLCEYFWKLSIALLFSMFTLPSLLGNLIEYIVEYFTTEKEYKDSIKIQYNFSDGLIVFFVFTLAFCILFCIFILPFIIYYQQGDGRLIFISFTALTIISIIAILNKLNKKNINFNFDIKKTLIYRRYKAFKENNCPMIEWETKNNSYE